MGVTFRPKGQIRHELSMNCSSFNELRTQIALQIDEPHGIEMRNCLEQMRKDVAAGMIKGDWSDWSDSKNRNLNLLTCVPDNIGDWSVKDCQRILEEIAKIREDKLPEHWAYHNFVAILQLGAKGNGVEWS
jgi:hypothetical protein